MKYKKLTVVENFVKGGFIFKITLLSIEEKLREMGIFKVSNFI